MREFLQDWVSAHAQRRPEATAVVLGEESLGYGELDAWSTRLARMLVEQRCESGDRICLLMPKTPRAVASILGIYKADCVYVPLDPASPPARLAAVIEACGARWVLAAGPVMNLLHDVRMRHGGDAFKVGWLDPQRTAAHGPSPAFDDIDVAGLPAALEHAGKRRAGPAHILFTSGSTGTPKGVVLTHRNVIAFIEWAVRHFGMTPADRVSGHTPLHFDLSVFDIFGAFAAGAELHLVPDDCKLLPNRLADWIRRSALTQWFSVPSVLNYMAKFDVVRPGDFPAMKRVMWCGEVMPTPSLIHWMQRLPHAAFTNLYGPTETTIASSHYTVPAVPDTPTAEIPLGTACDGEELLLLDETLEQAPVGEVADLYIRGVGLSPGYWNNPKETRKAFVTGPDGTPLYRTGDRARRDADGHLYYVGREDAQIKSRGYRIELGEIESALNSVRSLRESAVVAVPSGDFDGLAVCCCYVPVAGQSVTPGRLRDELRRLLPEYMVPTRWRSFHALPRNSSGKVDRKRLRNGWTDDAADCA